MRFVAVLPRGTIRGHQVALCLVLRLSAWLWRPWCCQPAAVIRQPRRMPLTFAPAIRTGRRQRTCCRTTVGAIYRVSQGNCSPPADGHRGSERYAYDFDMPVGTPFVAVRAGLVVHVEVSHVDGRVRLRQPDSITTSSFDMTMGRTRCTDISLMTARRSPRALFSRARPDDRAQWRHGNTNNFPHLHVGVHSCDPVVGGSAACVTQPITFRNTAPNPSGLQRDRGYEALPLPDGADFGIVAPSQ